MSVGGRVVFRRGEHRNPFMQVGEGGMKDEAASDSKAGTGLRAFAPALAMAVLTATGLGAAELAPPSTGQMAVVFPPLTGEAAAWRRVTEAGGTIVGPSRFSNVVIAYAKDPDFSSRVRSRGALFTLAATGLCRSVDGQSRSGAGDT
ncbi:hypothetical protein [Shinella granuli]|uniref:Uncharacterized protein n=1 Tax=Shinella granuli TaxID=323621 RepID=A0A4V6NL26_SHIGR|nr:hypothetical protein [Shinella granuli]TCN36810.1 hypothetical protein EV665_12471 [Shinella granuli]